MDLTIGIVSWNTSDLLDQCLSSVFENTGDLDVEVIVVDNASQDGSADMVCAEYPQAQVIRNDGNVGFARANNQAWQVSAGKYFALLNPDTIVVGDALTALIRVLETEPRCAVVAPRLLWPDGAVQPSVSRFPSLAAELCDALFLTKLMGKHYAGFYEPDDSGISVIDCARGACLVVRRSALEGSDVLLDERYFMFSEETDMCKSLSASGWHTVYEPRAQIVHVGAASTSQVKREMLARLYESKFLYFAKHHSRFGAGLYHRGILPLHCFMRLLCFPITRALGSTRYSSGETGPASQLYLLRNAQRWGRASLNPSERGAN